MNSIGAEGREGAPPDWTARPFTAAAEPRQEMADTGSEMSFLALPRGEDEELRHPERGQSGAEAASARSFVFRGDSCCSAVGSSDHHAAVETLQGLRC